MTSKRKKEAAAAKAALAEKRAKKKEKLRRKRAKKAEAAEGAQAEPAVLPVGGNAAEQEAPAEEPALEIRSADLICLAVRPDQYPPEDLPEIAFAGRSNVGKSSLLNLLSGRRQLARVSAAPGKTRTINFYQVDDAFRIVDLPGYGYASVSRSVSESWGKMMEDFFQKRPNLKAAALLVDSRHEPTAQDLQMYDYMRYYGFDGLVVMTKADKLTRRELSSSRKMIREALEMKEDDFLIPVSALKRTGRDELLAAMDTLLFRR